MVDYGKFDPQILFAGYCDAQKESVTYKNKQSDVYTLELVQPPYAGGVLNYGMTTSVKLDSGSLGQALDLLKSDAILLHVRFECSQCVDVMLRLYAYVNSRKTRIPVRVRDIRLISDSGRKVSAGTIMQQDINPAYTLLRISPGFEGFIRLGCEPYNISERRPGGSLEVFRQQWREGLRTVRINSLTAQELIVYFIGDFFDGGSLNVSGIYLERGGEIRRLDVRPEGLISRNLGETFGVLRQGDAWSVPIVFERVPLYSAEKNALFMYCNLIHFRQMRHYDAYVIDFRVPSLYGGQETFLKRMPVKTIVTDVGALKRLFAQAAEGFQSGGEQLLLAKSALLQILCTLIGLNSGNGLESQAQRVCRRIKDKLEKDFAQKLSISQLARREGIVPEYMCRVFNRQFGSSPLQYLAQIRIDEAKRLLTDTALPVEQVALRCGFESVGGFYKAFTKRTGLTPAKFRGRE